MDFPAFLERKTGGLLPEHVKLQGMVTQLYVAMDKRGRLYGEVGIRIKFLLFYVTTKLIDFREIPIPRLQYL